VRLLQPACAGDGRQSGSPARQIFRGAKADGSGLATAGVQAQEDRAQAMACVTAARDRCSRESARCACTAAQGRLGPTLTLAYPAVSQRGRHGLCNSETDARRGDEPARPPESATQQAAQGGTGRGAAGSRQRAAGGGRRAADGGRRAAGGGRRSARCAVRTVLRVSAKAPSSSSCRLTGRGS
jgi:hypothetical protein